MTTKHLTTGEDFGIVFHYADGTTVRCGSWTVPHDSMYKTIESLGSDVGWIIIHEMAKQPSRPVVRVEIVPWSVAQETP